MSPHETPPVDLQALERLRRWGGEALLRRMVEAFLAHAPARVDALAEAARRGDAAEANRHAHALVSSAGQIGAARLAALAAEVESRSKEPADLTELARLADEIDAEMRVVKERLDEIAGSGTRLPS